METATQKKEMILYRDLKYQQLFEDMCVLLNAGQENTASRPDHWA